MIKIFLESDKFSHIAGVTLHATNRLARKSHKPVFNIYLKIPRTCYNALSLHDPAPWMTFQSSTTQQSLA